MSIGVLARSHRKCIRRSFNCFWTCLVIKSIATTFSSPLGIIYTLPINHIYWIISIYKDTYNISMFHSGLNMVVKSRFDKSRILLQHLCQQWLIFQIMIHLPEECLPYLYHVLRYRVVLMVSTSVHHVNMQSVTYIFLPVECQHPYQQKSIMSFHKLLISNTRPCDSLALRSIRSRIRLSYKA